MRSINARALTLLGHGLALQGGPAGHADLLMEIQQLGFDRLFALAADVRLEVSLALALQARSLLPPIPPLRLPDGRLTITKAVADVIAAHLQRRAAMRERLVEIVLMFNQARIVPTLLKGARSLWTGHPEWRSLRDLDLLVDEAEAGHAQELLQKAGYASLKRRYVQFRKHHQPELFRADLPGWVEIHHKAAERFAEALLPTAALAARRETVALASGARAFVLRAPDQVLQGLVHHQFHHHDFRNWGWLSLKGLYEFAAGIAELDEGQRTELLALASQHPRLLAAFDLWLAAAEELFSCPINPPMAVFPDARRQWAIIRQRMTGSPLAGLPLAGHQAELALCLDEARLRRTAGGAGKLAKARVVMSLMTSLIPNTIVLPVPRL